MENRDKIFYDAIEQLGELTCLHGLGTPLKASVLSLGSKIKEKLEFFYFHMHHEGEYTTNLSKTLRGLAPKDDKDTLCEYVCLLIYLLEDYLDIYKINIDHDDHLGIKGSIMLVDKGTNLEKVISDIATNRTSWYQARAGSTINWERKYEEYIEEIKKTIVKLN